MSPVKVTGIADIDPLDSSAQIGLRCLDQQMVVIAHQTVRVDGYPKTLRGFSKVLEQLRVIALVPKYALAAVPAADHMIKRTGIFHT